MRMAGPDILLFAVGLLLFSGASYALVQQGGLGSSATGVYDVTHPVETIEVGKQAVPNFASATATFTVNATTVSKVTIVIACTDTVPGGTFRLQVQVEPPAASGLKADPKAGPCGTPIEIPVEIAPVPASGTVQAADIEDARVKGSADGDGAKAVGDWKVTVNGARQAGPLPGVPGAAGNPGGSITLNADTWTTDVKATNPK